MKVFDRACYDFLCRYRFELTEGHVICSCVISKTVQDRMRLLADDWQGFIRAPLGWYHANDQ